MPGSSESGSSAQAEGIIQQIDPFNRELRILVADAVVSFDVATKCSVFLHGESVKFRLLQPGDYVRLTYISRRGRSVARRVEVRDKHTSQGQSLSRHTIPRRFS
jgi:hypothetical protein